MASLKRACRFFWEIPSGQYVAKKNRTRRIRDGKEWERTGKPLISLGGCNFRKGKYLAFCRLSNSQCGGQGFDSPLLHQYNQVFTAKRASAVFRFLNFWRHVDVIARGPQSLV